LKVVLGEEAESRKVFLLGFRVSLLDTFSIRRSNCMDQLLSKF